MLTFPVSVGEDMNEIKLTMMGNVLGKISIQYNQYRSFVNLKTMHTMQVSNIAKTLIGNLN